MKFRFALIITGIFILTLNSCRDSETQPHTSENLSIHTERTDWFVEARFGMFIHWGVYSGAEGYWKGEKIRYDNNYAEWIQYRNQISKDEYLTLLDRFDWSKINPEQWVILAKEAGMKYVTLTAKHHDGFALWNSHSSNYDVAEYTNPPRDIVKELSKACKKHGLKFGLYYSHWIDWENPYGWDHSKEINPIDSTEYAQYWEKKVIPQMNELLTNYGNIDMLWFDMWINHSKTIISKKQLTDLKDMIRQLQPNCLINSRLGLSLEEDPDIDFKTLGDNQLGETKENFPWQSPATIAHSWGYHAGETSYKSATALLKELINNVSLSGNYILNIGPKANGDIPQEQVERLKIIGNWLSTYSESIYGAEGFDLPKDFHDWGKITCKHNSYGKTILYLHIYRWPTNGKLNLSGIYETPSKIWMLNDKNKQPLLFKKHGLLTEIQINDKHEDPYISVIAVEYEKTPTINEEIVAKNIEDGFSCNLSNLSIIQGNDSISKPQYYGSIPEHIQITQTSTYQWQVFIEKPCTINAEISYASNNSDSNGNISLMINNKKISQSINKTGKTVGEPNMNWHIDKYTSHNIGNYEITEPGVYTINLEISPKSDSPMNFQWIWLKNK